MAVTQNSDGNSKQPVEEGVEPSCREGVDVGLCGHFQVKNSVGNRRRCSKATFFQKERCQPGHRSMNKDSCKMVKSYKLGRKRNRDYESDSLSDIDDAEVSRYLNSTEETHYKRILWEAMNGKFTEAKKPKTESKKSVSVKKAAKTTKKEEIRRPSSRINYDALKLFNNELKERGSEAARISREDSYVHRTENSSNESSYNEDQHEIGHWEDNQTVGDHDGEMYYENGDEHFDDECFDF